LLEQGDEEKARHHLSGDFVLTGWTPQPLNKYQFLALMMALKRSMPDLHFEAQSFEEDYQFAQSNQVRADIQLTGTQTARFSLPPYEIPPSVVTPRKLLLPYQPVSFTVMGESIESMAVSSEYSNMQRIIAQLGSEGAKEQPSSAAEAITDWPQPTAQGWQAASPAEAQRLYNKQSNLYDPQGRSYTPSHADPDPAPQVDPAAEDERNPH
jgi:hypothetical protein